MHQLGGSPDGRKGWRAKPAAALVGLLLRWWVGGRGMSFRRETGGRIWELSVGWLSNRWQWWERGGLLAGAKCFAIEVATAPNVGGCATRLGSRPGCG